MSNIILYLKKYKNDGTSSVIFYIVLIFSLFISIVFDAVSIIALLQKNRTISIILFIISSAILAPIYMLYKDEMKINKIKNLKGINKVIVILILVSVSMDTAAIGFQGVTVLLPEKPVYDFSKVTDEDFDIFFLKEQQQSELAENIEQSLLLIKPLEKYDKVYLDKLVGYADIAPLAKRSEDIMLFMIHRELSALSDAEVREFLEEYENGISEMYGTKIPDAVMESIYDYRCCMDDECITAENRNCIFEDALSSANFKFREKYREDYKIAARYVWATLYASVGLDSFTEAEIDKVIRVYRNMLDSKEFDEYKENINLIISALELIKADTSFIDIEIVEMMANNN